MSINIEISNNFINDNFINDNSLVIFIFNKCNIDCQDLTQLHGFKLERIFYLILIYIIISKLIFHY